MVGDDKFIDAASVFSGGRFMRFSSTMMSYGYFGDLMARAEGWRWLGPARYIESCYSVILHLLSANMTLNSIFLIISGNYVLYCIVR